MMPKDAFCPGSILVLKSTGPAVNTPALTESSQFHDCSTEAAAPMGKVIFQPLTVFLLLFCTVTSNCLKSAVPSFQPPVSFTVPVTPDCEERLSLSALSGEAPGVTLFVCAGVASVSFGFTVERVSSARAGAAVTTAPDDVPPVTAVTAFSFTVVLMLLSP